MEDAELIDDNNEDPKERMNTEYNFRPSSSGGQF
jgi:hypothetical protein